MMEAEHPSEIRFRQRCDELKARAKERDEELKATRPEYWSGKQLLTRSDYNLIQCGIRTEEQLVEQKLAASKEKRQPEADGFSIEQVLVGALLAHPEDANEARQVVEPDDFRETGPRAVFVSIMELAKAKERVGERGIFERLRADGDDGLVGGLSTLYQWKNAALGESARSLAKVVRTEAERRRIEAVLAAASKEIQSGNPGEIAARVSAALAAARPAGIRFVSIHDAMLDLAADLRNPGTVGLSLGIHGLDKIVRGIRPGEFVVVGARPHVGKTLLATFAGANLAKARAPTGIISLETKNFGIAAIVLSQQAGIEPDAIGGRDGARPDMADVVERTAEERFRTLPLFVTDSDAEQVDRVVACIAAESVRRGLRVAIVDNLSLVRDPAVRGTAGRTGELSSVTAKLKRCAMSLGISIVAIAHLNRDAADREEPRLEDLKDSGSVEQDADVVILLDGDEKETGDFKRIRAFVRKRRGGRPGKARLLLDRSNLRIVDDPTEEDTTETKERTRGPRLSGPRKGIA